MSLYTDYKDAINKFWTSTIDSGSRWYHVLASTLIVLVVSILFIAVVMGGVLGVYWCFWHIYMAIMFWWFPLAPMNVLHPPFFVFMGTGVFLVWLRNLLFGKKNASKNKETY